MSIPSGLAGSDRHRIHLLEAVEPRLRAKLERDGIRRVGPSQRPPRPAHMVEDDEYCHVVAALVEAGLVEEVSQPAQVTNGIFGIPKSGTSLLRVILDARTANLLCWDPEDPELPSIAALAKLGVPVGQKLVAAVSDLANFYHLILIPEDWRDLFGISAVTVCGKASFYRRRTLPMGAAVAVWLAQHIHMYALTKNCLAFAVAGRLPSFSVPVLLRPDKDVAHAYIDDLLSLALSIARANHLLTAARRAAPVPIKEEKFKLAVEGKRAQFWGVELTEEGLVVPQQGKLQQLIDRTRELLGQEYVAVRDLQALTGKWLWQAMLCRLLLSTLNPLFRQCRASSKAVRWWPSSRAALQRLVVLSPLLVVNPARPPGRAAASDSSDRGGAVCLGAPLDEEAAAEVYWSCASLGYYKGRSDMGSLEYYAAVAEAVERQGFRGAYHWEWKDPSEFIGVKEARAAMSSLERVVLRAGAAAVGRRHWCFVDNQAFVGAFSKGRSANHSINSLLQRAAAWLLATGSTADMIWTPSALEPADFDSRRV